MRKRLEERRDSLDGLREPLEMFREPRKVALASTLLPSCDQVGVSLGRVTPDKRWLVVVDVVDGTRFQPPCMGVGGVVPTAPATRGSPRPP